MVEQELISSCIVSRGLRWFQLVRKNGNYEDASLYANILSSPQAGGLFDHDL